MTESAPERQQTQGSALPVQKKSSSGETVSESGIYRVWHGEHKLAREVILIRGMEFPNCPHCATPIYFELLMAAPYAGDDPDFAGAEELRKK